MLQMTRDININWKKHVAQTGVTCYTCHRGKPVPHYTWFVNAGPRAARPDGWQPPARTSRPEVVGLTSLPYDPFTPYLLDGRVARVVRSPTSLPTGNTADIKHTEQTYGLMMHMSQALGVNCTHCHNTRSFKEWPQSRPQRVVAWHGIRMVREPEPGLHGAAARTCSRPPGGDRPATSRRSTARPATRARRNRSMASACLPTVRSSRVSGRRRRRLPWSIRLHRPARRPGHLTPTLLRPALPAMQQRRQPWGRRGPDADRARTAPWVLCGCDARDRDRRARAGDSRRACVRLPRDRAQRLRRARPRTQGRGLRGRGRPQFRAVP